MMRSYSFALALAVLVAACKVGPDYQEPRADVSAAWREELGPGLTSGPADLAQW
jgi:hypothetical protein